jgi:hypothetical protein
MTPPPHRYLLSRKKGFRVDLKNTLYQQSRTKRKRKCKASARNEHGTTTKANKKMEEKGNGRSVRHTNPCRSSDRHEEADASTILLLERRGRCWINIMPIALNRSLSLSRSLPPSLAPLRKKP